MSASYGLLRDDLLEAGDGVRGWLNPNPELSMDVRMEL